MQGKHRAAVLSLTAIVGVLPCTAFAGDEDGVSPSAYTLTKVLGLPITNSMVTSWVFSILLIIGIQLLIKKPKLIPSRGQAIVESILESIRGVIEPIVGKPLIRHVLPLLLCLFTFILIQNWSGLIPGVGAFGHYDAHGHFLYYFRPGNADLNMTYALTIVHLAAWIYFVIRFAGPRRLLWDIFGNKADKNEIPKPIYCFLFLVFLFVGVIEVISILLRNVSLPFRLFGNVLAGENLLAGITSSFAYIVPVPFYLLETLVGFVQAFVFILLVSVYIGLICNHGPEEHTHSPQTTS